MKKRLNEDTLLRKIEEASRGSKGGGVRLGIGDDAAIWKPRRGYEAVLTCDWSLEGSHFLLEKHPADAIGWKSLARATSDIAAMGATARCYLLSLALPTELTGKWLTGIFEGIGKGVEEIRLRGRGRRYDAKERDVHQHNGGGRGAAGAGDIARGCEGGRCAVCEWNVGRGGFGLAGVGRRTRNGAGNECGAAEAYVSGTAIGVGTLAGGEEIGDGDDGCVGWIVDGFAEVVRGEWRGGESGGGRVAAGGVAGSGGCGEIGVAWWR